MQISKEAIQAAQKALSQVSIGGLNFRPSSTGRKGKKRSGYTKNKGRKRNTVRAKMARRSRRINRNRSRVMREKR